MKKEEDFLRLEGKESIDIDFDKIFIKKRRRNPFFLLAVIFLIVVVIFSVIKIKNDKEKRESLSVGKIESQEEWEGAFISEAVFLRCKAASVSVIADGRRCAGFVLSEDGWIVSTNSIVNEFVKGKIDVVLYDGSVYEVEAFKESYATGLVLMKIDAKGLVPVDLSFDGRLFEGQDIYTFCSVSTKSELSLFSGKIAHSESSVTVEEVGKKNRVFSLIQVSVLLTEQGTGAPLFDEEGRLIGIACSYGNEEGKYIINYAFPIKKTRDFLVKMMVGGYSYDDFFEFVLE